MRRIIGTAIGLAIIPTLLMIGYVTSRHPQGFVWFMVSAVCVFFGYVGYTMADIRGAPVMAEQSIRPKTCCPRCGWRVT